MQKEIMLNKVKNLLDEYYYDYTERALEKIIDEWYEQKEPLRNILRNHPNWNEEEDMVAFDIDVERRIDKNAIEKFRRWILCDSQIQIDHGYHTMWTQEGFPHEQFMTQEIIDLIKTKYPDFKAAVGQKTSRAMNKLFIQLGVDKDPNYNRAFAKYADALNPITVTRHTVISINLIDYLTMSFGNSWASCHTIDKKNQRGMPGSYEGCYSSGTLSYALDSTSIVFYTVDAKYNGNEYYLEPKINRQMFHFGEDKLVQGRLYPQSCDKDFETEYDQFRNLMQSIIALGLGVPNLWTLKRGTLDYDTVCSKGTHYKDYYHYRNCSLSTLKNSENQNRIRIGANPICIRCGSTHSYEENIDCCSRGRCCDDCDDWYDEDDLHYIEEEDRWVCDSCYEDYYECHECGRLHHRDNMTYVESVDGDVCDSCLDEYYYECDECGDYYRKDDLTYMDESGDYVCEYCIEDKYAYCNECGVLYRRSSMTEYENDYYCDDCYENKMNEIKEENEEDDEYENEAV